MEEKKKGQIEERPPFWVFLILAVIFAITIPFTAAFALWLGQQPWPLVIAVIALIVLLGIKAQRGL